MTATTIDLEKPESEEKVKMLTNAKAFSLAHILKAKLIDISLVEIITHLIAVGVVVVYVYLLVLSEPIPETLDTIAKIIIGAYIGSIFKKN